MPNRERMTSVDVAWLRMDRPENLMTIVAVLTFAAPVPIDALRTVITDRMLVHHRFRRRPVQDSSGFHWEDDPKFDLKRHVRPVKLKRPGGTTALRDLVGDLVSTPLDPKHPLWQFSLIERFGPGSAIIARIHHCYADGIALVNVMLTFMESTATAERRPAPREPDAPPPAPSEGSPLGQFLEPVTDALRSIARVSGNAIDQYMKALRNPVQALEFAQTGAAIGRDVAGLLLMPDDSRTRFKGKPGARKRVAWSEPIPLDAVKAAGHALGCSVNDVLLGCVAGALGRYLSDSAEPIDGVEIRALIPVNLRSAGKDAALGNRFGLVPLVLPIGLANPLARVREVHERMEALKKSYQAVLTLGILGLVGMCPKPVQQQILDILANKATAVMTNVPGPQHPLYLCGAQLDGIMFWVPQSGDIGMGVSILSYNGTVRFGLVTDAGLTPDPERVINRFPLELENLLYAVLMEPWGAPRDPALIEQELTAAQSVPGRQSAAVAA